MTLQMKYQEKYEQGLEKGMEQGSKQTAIKMIKAGKCHQKKSQCIQD